MCWPNLSGYLGLALKLWSTDRALYNPEYVHVLGGGEVLSASQALTGVAQWIGHHPAN